MSKIHRNLHDLETELIEINGLMEALQRVLPDGAVHTCVTNTLEERLRCLQRRFYEHWEMVVDQPQDHVLKDESRLLEPASRSHNLTSN